MRSDKLFWDNFCVLFAKHLYGFYLEIFSFGMKENETKVHVNENIEGIWICLRLNELFVNIKYVHKSLGYVADVICNPLWDLLLSF